MIRFSLGRLLRCALPLAVLVLSPLAAYAESADFSDAADASMSEDASATTDAGVAETMEDSGPMSDSGPLPDSGPMPDNGPAPDSGPDSQLPPDTGTPAPFNENPCWDDKCAKETAACKADTGCMKLKACKDQKCQEAVAKEFPEAQGLLTAIANCGYKACNDPTKGTCKDVCGKFLGNKAPCNCDKECKKFGDCCQDYDALCGGPPPAASCADKCDEPFTKDAPCQCDAECATNKDCCKDYETLCAAGPGPGACTPKCANKNCGADDGCKGKCKTGPCTNGGVCDPTGTCVGAAKPDAAAGETAGVEDGGATDGGAKADAAVNGTPVPPPTKSGGCSSTSTGGFGGWALALGAVTIALLRRRREV